MTAAATRRRSSYDQRRSEKHLPSLHAPTLSSRERPEPTTVPEPQRVEQAQSVRSASIPA